MIELEKFKAYIQGDSDNRVTDVINTHMFDIGQQWVRIKTEREDVPCFRVKEKIISNIFQHKAEYDFHIFVINPLDETTMLIADIIDSCFTNPKGVIVLINTKKETGKFPKEELKEIYKIVEMANNITNREVAILNDCYSVLDFIAETKPKDIAKSNEDTLINSINLIYQELQKKLPSEVFLNQSKVDNIGRVVYKYIADKLK